MAVKKRAGSVSEAEVNQAPKNAPVVTGDVVFVNAEKLDRAKTIIELVSGKRTPIDGSEAEYKERWARHFANGEVDPKGKDALQFAYEKLGGLVRTPDEQQEADDNAKDAQRKMKRRSVETDK